MSLNPAVVLPGHFAGTFTGRIYICCGLSFLYSFVLVVFRVSSVNGLHRLKPRDLCEDYSRLPNSCTFHTRHSGVWEYIVPNPATTRRSLLPAQHRTCEDVAATRRAANTKADESINDKGPCGIYDNWFRSIWQRSQGVGNALSGQCCVKRVRGLTCCADARLCCVERRPVSDVGRRAEDDERVGKGKCERAKCVRGQVATCGATQNRRSTLTSCK